MKTLAVVLVLSLPAGADEIVLRNGAAFSGVAREEAGKVTLELDFGTMTFPKSDVRSITKSDDPLRQYEEKLRSAKDVQGYYDVALWARAKGLDTRANDLLRKVISLDPDHEGARKGLGFQKIGGAWLEGDELMMARGYLKRDGRWLPKDTAEKADEIDKELQIENGRRETAERLAQMAHETDLARLQLDRDRTAPATGLWALTSASGIGIPMPTARFWRSVLLGSMPPGKESGSRLPVRPVGPARGVKPVHARP